MNNARIIAIPNIRKLMSVNCEAYCGKQACGTP